MAARSLHRTQVGSIGAKRASRDLTHRQRKDVLKTSPSASNSEVPLEGRACYHSFALFSRLERKGEGSVDRLLSPLARFLSTVEPGSRLPTMRDLAGQYHSSPFSIHSAIKRLGDAGAITVDNRGRLGAYLIDRRMSALWAIAERGPLVIAFPLASSRRYEGLATAIKEGFVACGIEAFLIFIRGSRRRVDALQAGHCHLAVMSSFAATALGAGNEIAIELPANTYNTGHRVFFLAGHHGGESTRYLVDRDSADQQLLSALEFGAQGKPVVATITQIARMLEGQQADAAVWTLDEMQPTWPPGVLDRPLSDAVRSQIGDTDTRAALVSREADAQFLRALATVLDPARVERTQADVLLGTRLAEY